MTWLEFYLKKTKSQYKSFKGFVCYIDLLGFSSLTNENSQLSNDEIKRKLAVFHFIIKKQISRKIYYSVISDSVFIYSTVSSKVFLTSLANIFRKCLERGILLRAGLDYGDYSVLRTKLFKNNIFGKAVTNAVALEKKGKGCRIFIDANFPSCCKDVTSSQKNIFNQYKNYQDYSYIDVFEWAYINENYIYKSNEKDSQKKQILISENYYFQIQN